MSFFPGYARWLALASAAPAQLSTEEKLELHALGRQLQEFKDANPDFQAGGPLRATLGDLLRARARTR